MDYNVAFLITTYNRPESLKNLVKVLKPIGDVYVIDDGSDIPVKIRGINIKRQGNKGKQGYWETVSSLWQMVENKNYDYYFMLQDDFYPVEGFVNKTLKIWMNIHDYNKICLTVYTDKSRYMKPCWSSYDPINYGEYIKTQWVDMCFFCEVDFFKAMGYKTYRTERDWDKTPELGSGVGSYITRKLYNKGLGMYQVSHSLFTVQPEGFYSKMNITDSDSLIYKVIL